MKRILRKARSWSCTLQNKPTASKPALRIALRALRAALSPHTRTTAAAAAANHLAVLPQFQQASHIACYLAYQHEFDLQPIIELIWKQQKICYLPIVTPTKTLAFVRYDASTKLQRNQYGILEPSYQADAIIPANLLDVVLVPAVGVDRLGRRLGSGGGYYDKTFAFVSTQTPRPLQPYLIAVAYANQLVATLPADAWDVTMHGVLTETAFLSC